MTNKIDSLKNCLNNSEGRQRALIFNELCDKYVSLNTDSAIKYGELGIEILKKERSNMIHADILNNLGNVYLQKGDYNKSLDNYITAEKIFEKENNLLGKLKTIINIGTVYELQNIYAKALNQYELALPLSIEIHNKDLESQVLAHLGSLFYSQNNKQKALEYFSQSLKINQEINNLPRIMEGLNNVGIVYQELGKYKEALENFTTDLDYAKKGGIKTDIIAILHNISLVYKDQKDYTNAIAYIDSSIAIGKEIREFEKLQEVYLTLSEIYKEQNNIEKAFEFFQLSAAAKDSLINQTRDKQFIEMSTKYDTEKKETENKLLKTESDKHRAISISIAIGLVLVAALAFFIFRNFRVQQKANVLLGKQNLEIKEQKHIIEEKQTEILDSINYAKRLQNAILPTQENIDECFPNNFVLYKPKDIVAGDFYWMETVQSSELGIHISNSEPRTANSELILIACADSTGHGVPGAMVSVVCSNALNRSVNEFGLRKTGEILDKTRELVLETFSKGSKDVKDGMDISLLSVNFLDKKIEWSGANNQLWYISNNELKEITANKQPIGKTDNPKPFTTHSIEFNTGDVFYLMTDGYPDQFGGPKGKKFKYKQLQELLIANASLSLKQQQQILDTKFNEWIGNLEQVDDVTIIGIKV